MALSPFLSTSAPKQCHDSASELAPRGIALYKTTFWGDLKKMSFPLSNAVLRAADAFEYANARGIDAAMNQFNQKPQEQ
jgi:hypothetical protein